MEKNKKKVIVAEKQQWKKRTELIEYIYSTLIKNSSLSEIKKDAFNSNLFDAYQLKIIEYYADNKKKIINLISEKLESTWTWERINIVEQAILITAIAESKVTNIEKNIIIDQAIISAKHYSEEKSIKYLNAILDKIL
ncbi:MAG: DUF1948 domain-containing protein [Mycoplasmataceae bacterium]|jgi:N utilization substance protein B|nr:DUF1948 domain-containing protein [Mycoplasmataceae bacterium]